MADMERYNGWANRETWAFNLYWSNDQALYTEVREWALELLNRSDTDDQDVSDYDLGEYIVEQVEETLRDVYEGDRLATAGYIGYLLEVGSRWRFDYAEIGAAVRESVTD